MKSSFVIWGDNCKWKALWSRDWVSFVYLDRTRLNSLGTKNDFIRLSGF